MERWVLARVLPAWPMAWILRQTSLIKGEDSKGDETEKKQKGKKWKRREAKRMWLEIGNTKYETTATDKCLVVTGLRKLCLVGQHDSGPEAQ